MLHVHVAAVGGRAIDLTGTTDPETFLTLGTGGIYGLDILRGQVIPEPTTLSLLVLGGLLVTRRRRWQTRQAKRITGCSAARSLPAVQVRPDGQCQRRGLVASATAL